MCVCVYERERERERQRWEEGGYREEELDTRLSLTNTQNALTYLNF
jgi:hypothetical protein